MSGLKSALKCTAFVTAAVLAWPALAQQDDGSQGETVAGEAEEAEADGQIIVSARRRDEQLSEVPASVAVLGARTLESAGIDKIDDLASFVPNLMSTARADETPDVVLRGVGSFGVVQGVGFYVNDVQRYFGVTNDGLLDLSHVEVLRGPQGTLYSGSNIGGSIKYITRRPTRTFEAQATVEAGSFDARKFSAIVSGPLSETIAARALIYRDQSDGYIYNTTKGEYAGPLETTGGRLTFEYEQGATSALLFLEASDVDRGTWVPYYIASADDIYIDTVSYDRDTYFRQTVFSPTLQVRHDFGSVELTSLTSYYDSQLEVASDVDFGPMSILGGSRENWDSIVSQELRLASTGEGSLQWLVGGFVQQREGEEVNLFNIFPAGLAFEGAAQTRRHQYAIFGDLIYEAGPWSFEAGARSEWNRNRLATGDPISEELSNNTQQTLYKGSVSYALGEDALAYASISTGFTPGDVQESDAGLVAYQAETVTNYEVGFHAEAIGGRLQLNGSAFVVNYEDRLFQAVVIHPTLGFTQYIKNIGKSRNVGFELDAQFRITPNVILSAAYGMTDGEWQDGEIIEPNTGALGFTLAGLKAPYTPEYQGSVSVDWAHDLSPDLEFGARVDAAFIGQRFWNLPNTTEQDAYELVNLSVRLEADHWTLRVGADNVFDTRYNTLFITGPEIGAPQPLASIGHPRRFSAALTLRH